MHIGYARVSTQDQDLSLQYDALRQAQCDKIYEDKASGAHASRDGLTLALEILRENDSLVVWKLDRLGRSVKDLVAIVCDLEQRGVHFKFLTNQIDTVHDGWPLLFSCHGQPGADGAGPDCGTHPGRAGCSSPARPHRRPQAQDDRFQNSHRKAANAGRRDPRGQWQKTWACPSRRCTDGCRQPPCHRARVNPPLCVNK